MYKLRHSDHPNFLCGQCGYKKIPELPILLLITLIYCNNCLNNIFRYHSCHMIYFSILSQAALLEVEKNQSRAHRYKTNRSCIPFASLTYSKEHEFTFRKKYSLLVNINCTLQNGNRTKCSINSNVHIFPTIN